MAALSQSPQLAGLPTGGARQSLVDIAYEALSEAITSGALLPGTRLREAALKVIASGQKNLQAEFRLRASSGEVRWLLLRADLQVDEEGQMGAIGDGSGMGPKLGVAGILRMSYPRRRNPRLTRRLITGFAPTPATSPAASSLRGA